MIAAVDGPHLAAFAVATRDRWMEDLYEPRILDKRAIVSVIDMYRHSRTFLMFVGLAWTSVSNVPCTVADELGLAA